MRAIVSVTTPSQQFRKHEPSCSQQGGSVARAARRNFNVQSRPVRDETSNVVCNRLDHRRSAQHDVAVQDVVTWGQRLLHIGDANGDIVGVTARPWQQTFVRAAVLPRQSVDQSLRAMFDR